MDDLAELSRMMAGGGAGGGAGSGAGGGAGAGAGGGGAGGDAGRSGDNEGFDPQGEFECERASCDFRTNAFIALRQHEVRRCYFHPQAVADRRQALLAAESEAAALEAAVARGHAAAKRKRRAEAQLAEAREQQRRLEETRLAEAREQQRRLEAARLAEARDLREQEQRRLEEARLEEVREQQRGWARAAEKREVEARARQLAQTTLAKYTARGDAWTLMKPESHEARRVASGNVWPVRVSPSILADRVAMLRAGDIFIVTSIRPPWVEIASIRDSVDQLKPGSGWALVGLPFLPVDVLVPLNDTAPSFDELVGHRPPTPLEQAFTRDNYYGSVFTELEAAAKGVQSGEKTAHFTQKLETECTRLTRTLTQCAEDQSTDGENGGGGGGGGGRGGRVEGGPGWPECVRMAEYARPLQLLDTILDGWTRSNEPKTCPVASELYPDLYLGALERRRGRLLRLVRQFSVFLGTYGALDDDLMRQLRDDLFSSQDDCDKLEQWWSITASNVAGRGVLAEVDGKLQPVKVVSRSGGKSKKQWNVTVIGRAAPKSVVAGAETIYFEFECGCEMFANSLERFDAALAAGVQEWNGNGRWDSLDIVEVSTACSATFSALKDLAKYRTPGREQSRLTGLLESTVHYMAFSLINSSRFHELFEGEGSSLGNIIDPTQALTHNLYTLTCGFGADRVKVGAPAKSQQPWYALGDSDTTCQYHGLLEDQLEAIRGAIYARDANRLSLYFSADHSWSLPNKGVLEKRLEVAVSLAMRLRRIKCLVALDNVLIGCRRGTRAFSFTQDGDGVDMGSILTIYRKCRERSCGAKAKRKVNRDECGLEECSKPGKKKCTACGEMWYCSTMCQKLDWKKDHKAECGSFTLSSDVLKDILEMHGDDGPMFVTNLVLKVPSCATYLGDPDGHLLHFLAELVCDRHGQHGADMATAALDSIRMILAALSNDDDDDDESWIVDSNGKRSRLVSPSNVLNPLKSSLVVGLNTLHEGRTVLATAWHHIVEASAAFGGGESKGGGEGGGGDTQIDVREGWYFLVDLVKTIYDYAYPPYAADLRVDLSVEYREGVLSSLLRILSNNNPHAHGNGLYDACRQHAWKATHSLLQRCLGASHSHSCAKVRCDETLWRPLMQALHRALHEPDWEFAWMILYGKNTVDSENSVEMRRRRMFASTADEDLLIVGQLLMCSSAWSTAAAAKTGGGGWQEGPGTLVDDYLNGLSASVLARELIDTRSSSVIYLLLYESLDLNEEEALDGQEQQLSERGESILRAILLEDAVHLRRIQAIVMADTGNRLSYLLDDYTRLLQLTPTNTKHQKAIAEAVHQALAEGDWAGALRSMFDTSGELNEWGAAILKRPEWTLLHLSQMAQKVEGGSDLEAVKMVLHGIVQTKNVDMNCTDATDAIGEALTTGNILVVEAFIMAGANLKDDKEMWSTKSKNAKFRVEDRQRDVRISVAIASHPEWKHRIGEAKKKRKKASKKARDKAREKRQKKKTEEEQAAKNTNGTAEGVDVGSTKKGAESGAADNDLKQSATAQALHIKGPGSPKGGGLPPDPTVDLMDQINALLRQVKEERLARDVAEAAEAAEAAKAATAKTGKDEKRDSGSGEGKSDESGKGRLVQPKSDDAIDRDIAWMEAGDEGDDANAIESGGSKKRGSRAAQQQGQEGGRMKGVAEESQVGPRYLHSDLRFDDLTWDVFFTDNVLKLLQKKMKREVGLCQAILKSIERLASGEWRIGNQVRVRKSPRMNKIMTPLATMPMVCILRIFFTASPPPFPPEPGQKGGRLYERVVFDGVSRERHGPDPVGESHHVLTATQWTGRRHMGRLHSSVGRHDRSRQPDP